MSKELESWDAWKEKVQEDINDLKKGQSQLSNDVDNLKTNDIKQDEKILFLQDTLKAIQSDTQWIRRKFTGALIKATVTAVVTGIVGYAMMRIYGV